MFFEFGIKDFIDILLVAMILYYIYFAECVYRHFGVRGYVAVCVAGGRDETSWFDTR